LRGAKAIWGAVVESRPAARADLGAAIHEPAEAAVKIPIQRAVDDGVRGY
jgi:hypothetical protein